MTRRRRSASSVCLLAAAAVWAVLAGVDVSAALGRDADIEFGGPGVGKGKFARIRDLAFGTRGRLYVLDGGPFRHRDKKIEGNHLVQKFDADGRFLGQFSVFDQGLGAGNDPARLAIDAKGRIYVTQPKAGVVQHFSAEGKLLSKYGVPDAYAVVVQTVAGRQRVLVAAQPGRGRPVAIRQLEVLAAAGLVAQPMELTAPLTRCDDLAVDREGNIYAHAEVNQIYKFDANGRHVLTIGGGTRKRREDGSELVTCVAVDSAGSIYSMGYGGKLVKFDPGLTTVTRRGGKFTWYDYWGSESILAVDPADRIWVAAGGRADGQGRYHFRPAVLRTQKDFFGKQADIDSTLLLGLNVRAVPRLPYHVTHGPGKVAIDFIVDKGVRRVRQIDVVWQARDVYGATAARGSFAMALTDGTEARREVGFVPPRMGWYTVEFQVTSDTTRLIGVGTHIGVTPRYDGMPVLAEGASKGGWEDPLRQAFCGLMLMRIHPRPGQLDKLDDVVAGCRKYGVTPLAQFTGKAEATPDFVRQAVTRFKGRIRYWEIINEPNFSFAPAEYVKLCRELRAVIKKIDPSAKVLAPAVCGVQLPWYKSFYELGGGKFCDILSIHDYEGHESADHHHWPRKLADLRALMARHGDADKPIWQTERGIPGVRASTFLGPTQAVRVLLHRNLLASLGMPSDHSVYYYLNQGGYGAYPAYLWSELGPHPAALGLRTRYAMLRGRRCMGRLDFGHVGNRAVLALRYRGKDGETVVFQNLGTPSVHVDMRVKGGGDLAVVDAFGNKQAVAVRNGKTRLDVGVMPIYLRLPAGRRVEPIRWEMGRNVAAMATFSYSSKAKRDDMTVLANGVFESPHFGYGSQYQYFEGAIEAFPQHVNMALPHPRTVHALGVHSLRADNMQTALLDFDVQARRGDRWQTVARVRTPMPASTPIVQRHCKANTWYMDTNFHLCRFPAVTTDWFRLVILRTTRGLLPDEQAEQITGGSFGPRLHLREIELFGPPPQVEVTVVGNTSIRTAGVRREQVSVVVTSRTAKQDVTATVKPPPGWQASPRQMAIKAAPGRPARADCTLTAPKQIPVGPAAVDVELRDRDGKLLDYNRLTLRFASPVTATPKAPPRIDATRQPMLVEVKNTSEVEVRGDVTLRIASADGDPVRFGPVEASFGPIRPGAGATVELLVPKLSLPGRPWRAEYAIAVKGLAERVVQDIAPVQIWHVLGPFSNDEKNSAHAAILPPEREVDLAGECEVHGGAKARWRPVVSDARGYVELAKLWEKRTFACAFAVAYVHSPSAREAVLSVGWDDGLKLWLNRRLIHEHESLSHGAKKSDTAKAVRLEKGWNEVLLKITQGHGGWGFYFDLLDPAGKPMKDATLHDRPVER